MSKIIREAGGLVRLKVWWNEIPLIARNLMAIRLLRSVAQGALAVDFVLYLRDMHWSAVGIGFLLMASGLVGAGLSLLVGLVSDKRGRKPFLLFYETGLAIGAGLILINAYELDSGSGSGCHFVRLRARRKWLFRTFRAGGAGVACFEHS
jgi:MFS family permease